MKSTLLSLFLLLSTLSCQRSDNNPSEVSAINRWIRNYENAVMDGDIEAILSGVSDAVLYFPSNQPAFSGKENLRKWLADYFNYFEAKELLLLRRIKVKGDLAYVLCDYKVGVKVKYSGEQFNDNGELVNIFTREPFGNWKCISSIWNSNNRSLDLHTLIPADFSGEWELDLSQSTKSPGIISSNMRITQKGNNLDVNRSYEVQGQKPTNSTFSCTIGQVIKNESTTKSLINQSFWSADRQSFTIIEKLIPEKGQEYKRTTVYSLTAKGENLNIISFDQLPDGLLIPERKIELVYHKSQK